MASLQHLALLKQNVQVWNQWRREHNPPHIDLSGANLKDINLCEGLLMGVNLAGADLRGAYLYKAELSGASLQGANLSRAMLSGANLTGVDLRRAILCHANLREADLRGAILQGADVQGADLRGTELDSTHFDSVCWDRSQLADARLNHLNLSLDGPSTISVSAPDVDQTQSMYQWESVSTALQQMLERLSPSHTFPTKAQKQSIVEQAIHLIQDNSSLKAEIRKALDVGGPGLLLMLVPHPLTGQLLSSLDARRLL